MFYFDPMYFVIIAPGLLLAAWASWRVKSTFHKASEIPAASGLTGAEAAHMILQAHQINNVAIEPTNGFLGDHYDSRAKVLRLSPDVYSGRSVAALGIAAHEAGHAVQDKVHYGPLALRNGIVPFAMVGSQLSWLIIFAGLVFGAIMPVLSHVLVFIGIGLFSTTVLFQLINLPVEYDASRRAKDLLQSSNLITPGAEATAMNRVLNAAALTYVAATLTAILTLLYLLLRSGILSGNNRN